MNQDFMNEFTNIDKSIELKSMLKYFRAKILKCPLFFYQTMRKIDKKNGALHNKSF